MGLWKGPSDDTARFLHFTAAAETEVQREEMTCPKPKGCLDDSLTTGDH